MNNTETNRTMKTQKEKRAYCRQFSPTFMVNDDNSFYEIANKDGLLKIQAISMDGHKTAERLLFYDNNYYYIGQVNCQQHWDFKVPKDEFGKFANVFNEIYRGLYPFQNPNKIHNLN